MADGRGFRLCGCRYLHDRAPEGTGEELSDVIVTAMVAWHHQPSGPRIPWKDFEMPLMEPPVALASCERSLRDLLTIALRAKFGADWISHVFDADDVTRLRDKQTVEQRRRTRRGVVAVPANLIEYAEFTQLTRLINRHWEALNGALGAKKEITVLLDRFEALRNTVAHSRELLPFEEELFSAIAGEIRNRVTIHISGQDPAGEYFPRIELVRDSFGNSTETAQEVQPQMFALRTPTTLRPGDVVTFTCRGVDPQNRGLEWIFQTPDGVHHTSDDTHGEAVEWTWEVTRSHIHASAAVGVHLVSDADYHRYGAAHYDALVALTYEVLPPLS
ncbi:hypothetical protein [Streptomyces sp. ME18-1-4]|uniref:hypothetical protein n=1 Tax=Streptomyces sp. ME18-1-4 TaxID=3028685 RepID=UPI00299F941A|nr:hypothetical protein [Streptomyces sp. ME18-1-4]MDX3241727.1 hypothetical protein [Streptomyces sp. ME18-1-4]